MQPTLPLLVLLAGCAATPEMPSAPPVVQNKFEGLKAVASCSSTLENETRITLFGEAADTANGPVIRFALVNTSTQHLKVFPYQLPWGNPNSVQIAATTLGDETLAVVWPIADPGQKSP